MTLIKRKKIKLNNLNNKNTLKRKRNTKTNIINKDIIENHNQLKTKEEIETVE